MEFLQMSLNELKQGYRIDQANVCCNYCQEFFSFDSEQKALAVSQINEHLNRVHGGPNQALVSFASKYNTLTEKQKELLFSFSSEKKDQEIADLFKVSPSTIRHQKFTFREKAKQAKVYLAQFEAVFSEKQAPEDSLIPVPEATGVIDDRFVLTEKEYAEIVRKYFDFSTGEVVLTVFPKGQKNVIGILNRIVEEFSMRKRYSGKDIDRQLEKIYFDYLLIKRYLIDYGFFTRTPDGSEYQRIY
ncbi:hypothetical protein IGI37_001722 [Enterococcus sp. AZ194]|uniref:DUF2087 domain-containing protein n=1 Tax=Enterococcus sp. AZ194 TaxID=2774629 RepID=UPI003F25F3AA